MPLAILGTGAVTAAGRGTDALWSAALAARPLAAPVSRYDTAGFATRRAALVPEAVWDALAARHPENAPPVRLARAAVDDCLRARALSPACALLVGTSLGGVSAWEPWHRALVLGEALPPAPRCAAHDDVAPALARALGLRGPALTVSTACTSGASALILAADMIRGGEVDEAVVVGVDVLGAFVHAGFDRLGALCPDDQPPAPFAEDRAGMWLGEAAAAVHLARDGRAIARYLGGASAGDGVHMTAPDREGRGMRRAIERALRDARRGVDEVAWVSAHATCTRFNDAMEAVALRDAFGGRVPPVHALKPVTGHTLGASGLVEVALAVEALRRRTRPPTATRALDPALEGISVDREPAPLGGDVALSLNAAMAGHDTALLLGCAP